jgi:hypothetical protein
MNSSELSTNAQAIINSMGGEGVAIFVAVIGFVSIVAISMFALRLIHGYAAGDGQSAHSKSLNSRGICTGCHEPKSECSCF